MATALSLNEIRRRCSKVVAEWQDEPGEERQQAQGFVRDLLQAYGITKTKAAMYERRAQRASTGGRGYIDALLPGLCLIEMKSHGRDLDAAEDQAIDYIESLPEIEQPRFVITSDFHTVRVLDLHDFVASRTPTEFPLDELPVNAESLAFLAGYQVRRFGDREQERASIKAAQVMAELYEALEGSGYDDHEANQFLVRTLFSLYADDSGIWERDLFFEFLENRTNEDGSDLGPRLSQLYQVMNTPIERRHRNLDELMRRFPYVNGGVFAEPLSIPSFDAEMRGLLLNACSFNWAGISPAIFGSLFQAVKSPEARRLLGEHYTTETNILKTINPLFMDELRQRFARHAHDIVQLKRLRSDLEKIRVLDPACGCGNFLVVAYRELRDLDLQILQRLQALGDSSSIPTLFFERSDLPVRLEHFIGIEIEEWPASIASTALYLVDHQANQRMELALGKAPESLPLETLSTIHIGNALRTDWRDVVEPGPHVRIVGNPPFIGQYTKSADQTSDLKLVWGDLYDGYLDYVTGWFKKASDYFDGVEGGRFAFVSTNSIAQGQPVPALFGPLFAAGWRIRFAHQTFPWESEAPGMAHVHCVITGYDKRESSPALLYSYEGQGEEPAARPVKFINAYLLNAPDVLVRKRSRPLSSQLPIVRFGSKPADGGNLIVEVADYAEVAADPVARKYLRKFRQGREVVRGLERWCLWMADEEFDSRDVSGSDVLRSRVAAVKRMRESSKKTATRISASTPHLFQENHQTCSSYVGIPRVVSESRRYFTAAYLEADIIAGDQLFTAEDPDGFLFGIISSSMFITWQRAIGGALESRLRFSNTVVWNNLPLPEVSDRLRDQVIATGKGVLDARALHPERSLADHYNPLAMDPALLKAHAALDRVVDRAFGASRTLETNEQRLEILFKRYAELTAEA